MKTKTKIQRTFKSHPILFSLRGILILIGLNVMACGIMWVWQITQIQPVYAAVEYQEHATKLTDKEYVLEQFRLNGLDPKDADCLITSESGWRKNAWNVNNNGSVDNGLYMINTINTKGKHPISVPDAYDVVKATRWTIEKRLRDGNYNAWYGYLANCTN
jgi:hypothetical protein